ncbi:Zinc finger, C3HC [Salix suchowensis]|nr:Zinc finger, C3HC [Salix suchowensis]
MVNKFQEQIFQAVKIFIGAQEQSQGTTDGVQVPVNSEVVAYSTGKDPKQLALDKTLGFDPIRQHRHYCTWIISTSSGAQVGNKTICFRASERVFSSFYKLASSFLRD